MNIKIQISKIELIKDAYGKHLLITEIIKPQTRDNAKLNAALAEALKKVKYSFRIAEKEFTMMFSSVGLSNDGIIINKLTISEGLQFLSNLDIDLFAFSILKGLVLILEV